VVCCGVLIVCRTAVTSCLSLSDPPALQDMGAPAATAPVASAASAANATVSRPSALTVSPNRMQSKIINVTMFIANGRPCVRE